MVRTLAHLTLAGIAAALLVAAPAFACGDEGEHAAACPHTGAKAEAKKAKADGHAGCAAKKAKVQAAAEEQPAAEQTPQAAPAQQGSILDPVDRLLAETCSCKSRGECTCKKGKCECDKCEHHRGVKKVSLVDSVEGRFERPELPSNARLDATAGIFI
jgi:hypothetical protein